MDFFDPQKQKRHDIRLGIGYAVLGLVLVLATTILLYQAYGFGLDKEGHVIQNGLVFVSSQPGGADVYVNGQKYKNGTDTHMSVPAGQYLIELKRDGYHSWKRVLTVEGGSVERFDYPFLFPVELTTTPVRQYTAAPSLSTQSLDRKWLLVATPEQNKFDLYDLTQKKLSPTTFTLSPEILSAGSTTTGWQLVEWSKDNRHVVLKRAFDAPAGPGFEYVLVDREHAELSQNLSVAFGFTPTTLELKDRAYDQYYLFDQNSGQLFTASLREPTPQPYLSGVLSFTSEGSRVAYATAEGAPAGGVFIRIKEKQAAPLTVRRVPVCPAYVLDMGVYEGNLYLAAGATIENRVFVFKDPIGALRRKPKEAPTPVQILKVDSPAHVSFSASQQFVAAENAEHFSVYDLETDRGYTYQSPAPLDAPQPYATWMDGVRLAYVSGGKVVVFDADGANLQTLSPAAPAWLPVFDRDYRTLYTLTTDNALTGTALLTQKDL